MNVNAKFGYINVFWKSFKMLLLFFVLGQIDLYWFPCNLKNQHLKKTAKSQKTFIVACQTNMK